MKKSKLTKRSNRQAAKILRDLFLKMAPDCATICIQPKELLDVFGRKRITAKRLSKVKVHLDKKYNLALFNFGYEYYLISGASLASAGLVGADNVLDILNSHSVALVEPDAVGGAPEKLQSDCKIE